jgi:hypothetical protein
LCLPASYGKAPPKREVRAAVIAVEGYPDGTLRGAATNADQIALEISKTYNTKVTKLYETNATTGALRNFLGGLSTMPKDSLLILYFAGHGYRQTPGKEPLLLGVSGVTRQNFKDTGFNAQEIISAIKGTARGGAGAAPNPINAIIFLDCCFAGTDGGAIKFDEAELDLLGARVFVLAAATLEEQTVQGVFARNLVKVWKSAANDCLTPSALMYAVQTNVWAETSGLILPEMAFRSKVERCFVKLGDPSCLLFIEFPNGCRDYCAIEIGDGPVTFFNYTTEKVFFAQVSKHKTRVTIQIPGCKAQVRELSEKELSGDAFSIEIPLTPPFSFESASSSADAAEKKALALSAYGTSSEQAFITAAKLHRLADPKFDTGPLLVRAFKSNPNSIFLAVATRSKVEDADLQPLRSRDTPEIVAYSKELAEVGRTDLAGDFCIKLASMKTTSLERSLLGFTAWAHCMASGNKEKAKALDAWVNFPSLSPSQQELVANIRTLDEVGLRKKLTLLPRDVAEWEQSRTAAMCPTADESLTLSLSAQNVLSDSMKAYLQRVVSCVLSNSSALVVEAASPVTVHKTSLTSAERAIQTERIKQIKGVVADMGVAKESVVFSDRAVEALAGKAPKIRFDCTACGGITKTGK